jgi:hypothetical protein
VLIHASQKSHTIWNSQNRGEEFPKKTLTNNAPARAVSPSSPHAFFASFSPTGIERRDLDRKTRSLPQRLCLHSSHTRWNSREDRKKFQRKWRTDRYPSSKRIRSYSSMSGVEKRDLDRKTRSLPQRVCLYNLFIPAGYPDDKKKDQRNRSYPTKDTALNNVPFKECSPFLLGIATSC